MNTFLTAADLSTTGTSAFRGLGAVDNPAGLVPGVDYYHPKGLRIKYAFTRSQYKAQLPTEKPTAGWWWVLTQLPNGYYMYEHKIRPGTSPEEAEKNLEAELAQKAAAEKAQVKAMEAADAAAVARAKAALPPAKPTPTWVKPAAIAGGVLLVVIAGWSYLKG